MIMRVTVNLQCSEYRGRGGTLLAFVTRIQLEGQQKKNLTHQLVTKPM